jgi:predicted metal-dependent phosphoesterase TrpH
VGRAIEAVRLAGGVASWAHPAYDEQTPAALAELASMGLGAVEVAFPNARPAHAKQLRLLAGRLGLAITGGSDCHGPGKRNVGSITVSDEELRRLRGMRCSMPSTKQ